MAYDPYKDLTAYRSAAESGGIRAKDVYDLVKKGQTFYRSTYEGAKEQTDKTKDYILRGEAYRDEGAEAIRDAYADYARTESGHKAAALAGENGGNLNSYAAAQANRSAAAMLGEGESAVAERAERIEQGLLKADEALLDAAKEANAAYARGVDDASGAAKISAEERGSALDALLQYYGILKKA